MFAPGIQIVHQVKNVITHLQMLQVDVAILLLREQLVNVKVYLVGCTYKCVGFFERG